MLLADLYRAVYSYMNMRQKVRLPYSLQLEIYTDSIALPVSRGPLTGNFILT